MMNLQYANFALQFARSFFNVAALLISDDHFLRQKSNYFGMSYLDILIFPTLFLPTCILFYFGINTLWSAIQDLRATSQLWKQNERLTLSGVVRLKATPVILRQGIEQLHRNALASVIIGLGLLSIGGVFVVLWVNLITPLPVLFPVTWMMTAVFVINLVNFKTVIYAVFTSINMGQFMVLLEKNREQLQEANASLARKKYKLPSSELLLLLFDAGFSGDMYGAFCLIDASLTTFSTSLTYDLDPDRMHKLLLGEHKSMAESLKRVCIAIETENKSPDASNFTSHLNHVQRKLRVDLCWEITSLVLNCVACFGLFLFPILTFFPSASVDFNSNAMYIGDLVGNMAWLWEAVLFVIYKNSVVEVTPPDAHVGFEKKNK